jgi:hypothetical protein
MVAFVAFVAFVDPANAALGHLRLAAIVPLFPGGGAPVAETVSTACTSKPWHWP